MEHALEMIRGTSCVDMLIIPIVPWGYYPYFTNKEVEAWCGEWPRLCHGSSRARRRILVP